MKVTGAQEVCGLSASLISEYALSVLISNMGDVLYIS